MRAVTFDSTAQLLSLYFAAALIVGCTAEEPAPPTTISLAVVNTTIWTGDRMRPIVDAIGVSGSQIAALGTSASIRALATDGLVLDAAGGLIVPGFIDAHIHLIDAGYNLLRDPNSDGQLENSVLTLSTAPPQPRTQAEDDAALDAALEFLTTHGVTSVHNMGSWTDLETLERAVTDDRLTTRVYSVLPLATWQRLRDDIVRGRFGGLDGRGSAWLRVGAVKGLVDGTLATETAALDTPYPGSANDRGLLLYDNERLFREVADADAANLQVTLHAVGERANALALDAYERVARANGPRDRRFRIEHAQHLRPDDVPRFGNLNVIASIQPTEIMYTGRRVDTIFGVNRTTQTFPIRSLLETRARVAFGTDWAFAPPGPLEGLFAAVSREQIDGSRPRGRNPTERITVAQALEAYTATAAYASFDENTKGRLAVGHLADFVLLDTNLLSVPSRRTRAASVLLTVINGQIVFDGRTPSVRAKSSSKEKLL